MINKYTIAFGSVITSIIIVKAIRLLNNHLVEKFRNETFYDKKNNRIFLGVIEEEYSINNVLHKIDENRDLQIVINSDGGSIEQEEKIINKLVEFKKDSINDIIVYVPVKCFSAAIGIMLTGDKVFANYFSCYTQIDVMIPFLRNNNYVSARYFTDNNGNHMIGYAKDVMNEQENTMQKIRDLNKKKYNDNEWKDILDTLMRKPKYTHDKRYTLDDMKQAGLKFDGNCPYDITALILPITRMEKLLSYFYFLKLLTVG